MPLIVFSLLGGARADAMDRRMLLIIAPAGWRRHLSATASSDSPDSRCACSNTP